MCALKCFTTALRSLTLFREALLLIALPKCPSCISAKVYTEGRRAAAVSRTVAQSYSYMQRRGFSSSATHLFIRMNSSERLRDGLAVKSTPSSSRGPEFHSQHPSEAAHIRLPLQVLRITPLICAMRAAAHTWYDCAQTHAHIYEQKVKISLQKNLEKKNHLRTL